MNEDEEAKVQGDTEVPQSRRRSMHTCGKLRTYMHAGCLVSFLCNQSNLPILWLAVKAPTSKKGVGYDSEDDSEEEDRTGLTVATTASPQKVSSLVMGMQSTIIITSNSISEIESNNFHKEIKDVVSAKIDGLP